jgi:hypothetical protein
MTSLAKNLLTRIFRRNTSRTAPAANRFRPSMIALEDRTVPSGTDAFGTATVLTGTFTGDTGSTLGATGELQEPVHAGDTGLTTSIWWQWTAPASGTVDINTFGSDYDTLLAVYTAPIANPGLADIELAAESDDAMRGGLPVSLQSQVLFQAVAGTTYYIAVDGFGNDTGNVSLHLGMPQANDAFANAVVVTGGTVTGSNSASTAEVGEPVHGPLNPEVNSVWYTWTAPTTESVEINTFGSDFDTLLAVYTGVAVDDLAQVAGNDDAAGGLQSQVIFNAVAGTVYHIAVDGSQYDTGVIVLTLPDAPTSNNNPPAVENQSFSVNENSVGGTSVGTVVATDPDAGQTLRYEIIGGNPTGAFSIDMWTGEIKVLNGGLNYEAQGSHVLEVRVTDNGDPELADTAFITINLNDVNETPTANPAGPFSLNENSAGGTPVGTVTASDPDFGQTLTFSIVSGNTNGAFAIDANTGAITVANAAALDFETTPSFNLVVQVTDSGTPSLSATTSVSVSLIDVNELTPAQQFLNLHGMVTALFNTGTMTKMQEGRLHRELDAAERQYNKGNIVGAESELQMFIAVVNDYINTGILTVQEGQPLIDAAQDLIDSI